MKSKYEGIERQLLHILSSLPEAWNECFREAGLRLDGLTPENMHERLKETISVCREYPGLEDLSPCCNRGVTPGDPALSLLYHMLASPHVHHEGMSPSDYPSIRQLEIVENFIYAAAQMTAAKARQLAGGRELAIVMFAYEYVPAKQTVHGRHADLCFSRTGISRIGNAKALYIGKARGYFPYSDELTRAHVVPARFGAFLAYRAYGDEETIGPMDFTEEDRTHQFWVPFHKLFNGMDCIQEPGLDLEFVFQVRHVNEKIRKVHEKLRADEVIKTPLRRSEMSHYPFTITEGLAEFDAETGLMMPCVHDPLVRPAKTRSGVYVGFPVTPKHPFFGPALHLEPPDQGTESHHPWPEFVHIRHKIHSYGNDEAELVYLPGELLAQGQEGEQDQAGFVAANFVDPTGDGFVKASCPTLTQLLKRKKLALRSVAAYSILAQPDFFPLVPQREVATWWRDFPLKGLLWLSDQSDPTPLSSIRVAANIRLKGSGFQTSDTGVTSILSPDRKPSSKSAAQSVSFPSTAVRTPPRRESALPYRASGVFGPGWDISQDSIHPSQSDNTRAFLANHGTGSPYAEDTVLCASLGAFWPGAVPDTTRFFAPNAYPTLTPMTDEEATWNGVSRPNKAGEAIEYRSSYFVDYVRSIFQGHFQYAKFANLTLDEFILRTTITARFYLYLSREKVLRWRERYDHRARIVITSFVPGKSLPWKLPPDWNDSKDETFCFEWGALPKHAGYGAEPHNPAITRVDVGPLRRVIVGPSQVADEEIASSGDWRVRAMR